MGHLIIDKGKKSIYIRMILTTSKKTVQSGCFINC